MESINLRYIWSRISQCVHYFSVNIEEAAEILEAHVVTSLTKECQHLIMIGDHQQLQPSATVHELATKYGLETSLFERLIKNGIAFETLEWQHRMRSSISKLLVPSVYPLLKDHESVQQYPHIKGMQKDVFFITHKYREDKEWDDVHSKANTYEAELLMALCRHLILQGYSTEDVTILTPYSGQFFVLKEVQQRHSECANVNISLVDNYQGEESNIVLLSLVRSNEEGSVGFLRKENRVCVALSRAKQGLYIAGNMSQLKESNDLWRQVYVNLLVDDCIGNSIGLKCENHPEVVTHVSSSKEILTLCPEGGCTMPCKSYLPDCGHKCPRMCHIIDGDHANVKCPFPCSKKCENNHSCPRECWEDCPPCQALLPKTFPCKHRNNVSCCEYYSDQPCLKLVTKVLPVCQHEAILKCNENPSKFPCRKICGIQISCGHKCTRSCHLTDDPNHLDYRCEQPCRRVPAGCTEQHKCQKLCHEYCGSCTVPKEKIIKCGHSHNALCSTRAEDVDCNKTCNRQLDCGHSCRRKCNELCGGCDVMVKKIIPNCHHIIQVACKEPALKSECEKPCSLKLTCGHSCQARCRDSCTVDGKVGVTSEHKCPHGHHIKVPCHLLDTVSKEIAWTYCSRPCGTKLDCGHNCKGLCGQCFNGRLHAACDEKCGKRLVCGHRCNANCGLECPPCQAKCPVRCQHSRCQKKCGEPCSPCQEKCERSCQHHKCNKPCREKCSQRICEKSCRLKLMCGHSCIGFCGDPCPPFCKVCHKDQLNELLSGSEDLGSARFVLLEDCGHVIGAKVLREWLSEETEEIGMKCCPRCKTPIFNNRRYHKFLLKAYANVRNLLDKYCKLKPVQVEKDFENLKQNLGALTCFESEVQQISRCLPTKAPTYTQKLLNAVSDGEITLCKVQVEVLRVLDTLLAEHSIFRAALMPHVNALKKCLMRQMLSITPQMIREIGCELQRISLLSPYWTLRQKSKINGNDEVRRIEKDLQHLMSPSLKFDSEREKQFKQKLKESEKYVGDLDIKDHERFEIVNAVGLKHGHWYKCTKGHIYCTTKYGKAMEETLCFECETNLGK